MALASYSAGHRWPRKVSQFGSELHSRLAGCCCLLRYYLYAVDSEDGLAQIVARESFDSSSKWIEDVRNVRGTNVIMVLVGNKIDLEKNRYTDCLTVSFVRSHEIEPSRTKKARPRRRATTSCSSSAAPRRAPTSKSCSCKWRPPCPASRRLRNTSVRFLTD